NAIYPHDFGLYVLALARWFNDAYVIWEANGPGGAFGKTIIENNYHRIFYRRSDEINYAKQLTKSPGFWSNRDTKKTLLSGYAVALKTQAAKNCCIESLKEALQYVDGGNGELIHARSKTTQDPTAAGENHGDMVIADALAVRAFGEIHRRE